MVNKVWPAEDVSDSRVMPKWTWGPDGNQTSPHRSVTGGPAQKQNAVGRGKRLQSESIMCCTA